MNTENIDTDTGETQTERSKGKKIEVVINGMLVDVEKKTYSFDEIIAFAFESPSTGHKMIYTVSYVSGHGGKSEER